jgi:hypothetical protein
MAWIKGVTWEELAKSKELKKEQARDNKIL